MRHRLADERGSVTVWVAVLLGFILIGFGGLVHDASGAATQRSEIIDAAWSLARTGASQTIATATGVVIEPTAAQAAIDTAAARQWPELSIRSTISADQVTVTVAGAYSPKLLSALGVGEWDLTASRTSNLESS